MIVSFRHDKQRTSRRRRVLGLFFLLALGIFFVRATVAVQLGGFLARLGGPIWTVEGTVLQKARSVSTLFAAKFALEEENRRLNDMIDGIALDAFSYNTLREENEELKRALGRAPEYSLLLARVLATPAASPYDTLVIDVGSRYGITPGMEVFADGDFLIGHISRVWKETAVVELYSSPGSVVSFVIGSSSTPAIGHGAGGGVFRATLPKGLELPVGSLVSVPALSPSYVGVIQGVVRSEGSSLQELYTALPFNIYELRFVYVATSENIGEMPSTDTSLTIPQ
jgi:cell shape-determining protein MreC